MPLPILVHGVNYFSSMLGVSGPLAPCLSNWFQKSLSSLYILRVGYIYFKYLFGHFLHTSGFWPRVRARALRAPAFLGSVTWQTGRCTPPYRSFGAPPPPQKKTISRNKMLPFRPKLAPPGAYIISLG